MQNAPYILVTGERQRLNDASQTDILTFRLDLGVSNGQLIGTISSPQLDGIPVGQNRLDYWNQTIASRLVILGKKNPKRDIFLKRPCKHLKELLGL